MSCSPPDVLEFQEWLRARGRGRSAVAYARATRRMLADRNAFMDALVDRKRSPSYRRFLVAVARSWAKFARDDALREALDDLRLPSALPLTIREAVPTSLWRALRDAIDSSGLREPLRLACALVASRGLRAGDVLRLQRADLVQAKQSGVLSFVAKGEKRVEVPTATFLSYLDALLELPWSRSEMLCELICPRSKDPEASAARAVRRAFDSVAMDLGIDPREIHAHRFRHTYAHELLQHLGSDPEALLKLMAAMGWSRLDTAAVYLRRKDRLAELAEVDAVIAKRLVGGKTTDMNGG